MSMNMELSLCRSTLEILPDEILLEICKYLLCSDILFSFSKLNYRMTQMITEYHHHVSFHKTSIRKFEYLCMNILPEIGSQIRSLVIDPCYSVLQDNLFIEYFGNKMSIIFPKLERISLVSFEYQNLMDFLRTLYNLKYLHEIHLYSLFPMKESYRLSVTTALLEANNHRITTVFNDHQSSHLNFYNTNSYLNILRLRIKLKILRELPYLFAAIPNVHYLDIILTDSSTLFRQFNEIKLSPLLHLTDFQLISDVHRWKLEELSMILVQLPTLHNLSLFLSTDDRRLINGGTLLSILPSTVQQFNYSVYFVSDTTIDSNDAIITSWPSSHPIACYYNNKFLFIHTLPWHFATIQFSSSSDGEMIFCRANSMLGYDEQVEELQISIDKDFTLSKSLAIISQCRRVRNITINVNSDGAYIKEEQLSTVNLPKLPRLTEFYFYGSNLSNLNYFLLILNAASNLFSWDMSFENLWKLIQHPKICHLLGQRITTLFILKNRTNSSFLSINEKHIPLIASTFSRVRVLFIDCMHLPSRIKRSSTENSSVQNYKVIPSFSSESMLITLLKEFKKHKLISLCIEGDFLNEIQVNAEQWLRANTILCDLKFKANFNNRLNRLMIWM